MGTPKQLLPVSGGVLLGRVLDHALISDLDTVVLVLGHRSQDIQRALGKILQHPKLQVVENPHYAQGISSSILSGLQCVEKDHDHVMILLGDMPHVDAGLINLLLRRYMESSKPLGAIRLKGRRSHPVVFGRRLYGELHQLTGDVGARGLFEKYRDRACLVEPRESYDPRDVDTPEDYAALQREGQE
jgi:molybdenum cofactor cytidylyltransferase